LTDGVLLGLCSAWAVSSFLPVSRLGLINLEGYIAFSLFPLLSAIPLYQAFRRSVGSYRAILEMVTEKMN